MGLAAAGGGQAWTQETRGGVITGVQQVRPVPWRIRLRDESVWRRPVSEAAQRS